MSAKEFKYTLLDSLVAVGLAMVASHLVRTLVPEYMIAQPVWLDVSVHLLQVVFTLYVLGKIMKWVRTGYPINIEPPKNVGDALLISVVVLLVDWDKVKRLINA